MRKFAVILVMMMLGAMAWCQAPQKFRYQAVVRNFDGELVANKDVRVRASIYRGESMMDRVFSEEVTKRTTVRGLLEMNVGETESLAEVKWLDDEYYLMVELWPVMGEDKALVTTQKLVSVPYALHGGVADTSDLEVFVERQVLTQSHDTVFLTGGSFIVLPSLFDGRYSSLINKPRRVSDFDNDVGYLTEEVQVLSKSGDTVFLTGGSFVLLPRVFDGDYNSLTNRPSIPTRLSQLINDAGYLTQEVQVLSISNDTIYLTGGSFVKLPVLPELQNLGDVARLGNRVGLKQLKDVRDPRELQDVVTLHYLDSILNIWQDTTGDHGYFHVLVVDTCDSYVWHGQQYTENGTYTYAYSNVGGYFSVDTLKLSLRVGSYNPEYVSVSGSYTWHDSLYTSSGTHVYEYVNEYGCPSVDTLFLTINAGGGASCTSYRFETDTATVTACGWLDWYGKTIHSAGVYEHSLGRVAMNGCDSVVRVKVKIKPMFQKDTAIRTTTSVTWRGNTYTEQGNYGDTMLAMNGCDSIYMLHLMIGGNEGIGASKGIFSVSGNKKVRFANGNLQFQSSSNYWQFAEHQYDMVNVNCESKNYSGWSDLFGWGTSGYHNTGDSLCKNYYPWSNEDESAPEGSVAYQYNQYGYGPSRFMPDTNLTGASANYDWGMYHPIINGGNGAGLWRLLTRDEWNYILNQRPNATSLRALGSITNVPYITGENITVFGYILLQDGWTCPQGIRFNSSATSAYDNSYSLSQWEKLEASGAVFLPIGNGYTSYWSSTSGGSGSAWAMAITGSSAIFAPYNRSYQYGVRLVQEYHDGVRDCECTYFDTTIICDGNFAWHGYSYSKSGEYMESLVNNAGCDSIVSLSLILEESGELSGVFSVSDSTKVKFSKGNLQYKATSKTWRFANEQYGYVGTANKFVSENYDGWIDLFSWATSGYHDVTDMMNKYYKPWQRNGGSGEYGPSLYMRDRDLKGTSKEYDWGIHNAVANGGNIAGLWRTLSYDEWEYLINGRANASNLRGGAVVNDVYGIVILPDNWRNPSGVYFSPNNSDDNNFTDYQWGLLEAAGAVFLPIGGHGYSGSNIVDVGTHAGYWSITNRDRNPEYDGGDRLTPHYYAYILQCYRGGSCYITTGYKSYGYNVRLVKDY